MKKTLILFTCLILCLCTMISCGDYLNSAPSKVKASHEAGDSISLNESLLKIDESLNPSNKKDGYIEKITLKAKITGYDEDYTYFDGAVTIHWSYLEITDEHPTGVEITVSETIQLNANGDGSFEKEISLTNCRGVSNIDSEYTFSGKATRL